MRIAADDIKIGFNQVTLGIMPAWGGAERLALAVVLVLVAVFVLGYGPPRDVP